MTILSGGAYGSASWTLAPTDSVGRQARGGRETRGERSVLAVVIQAEIVVWGKYLRNTRTHIKTQSGTLCITGAL